MWISNKIKDIKVVQNRIENELNRKLIQSGNKNLDYWFGLTWFDIGKNSLFGLIWF